MFYFNVIKKETVFFKRGLVQKIKKAIVQKMNKKLKTSEIKGFI